MVPRLVDALVTPSVLRWARESLGLSEEDMASRVGTTVERVQEWEEGTRHPTVRQARLWARATRRPFVVFYLPGPPNDFKPLQDFRRLPGREASLSLQLRLQIRSAHENRALALDLAEEMEEVPAPFPFAVRIDDEVEDAGNRVREFLGIGLEQQKAWSGLRTPLREWRTAMEQRGILVFQTTGVDMEEVRGFSIAADVFPAVVLNPRDSPRGRVFTLLHEFVHVALRRGGLCTLEGRADIEVFCNAVAGNALVPTRALADQTIGMRGDEHWTARELKRLALLFSVSEEVILRRLVGLRKASSEFYQKKRAEWLHAYRRHRDEARTGQTQGPPPFRRAITEMGPQLLSLAMRSYWEQRISLSDLASISGVAVDDLPKIQAEVF